MDENENVSTIELIKDTNNQMINEQETFIPSENVKPLNILEDKNEIENNNNNNIKIEEKGFESFNENVIIQNTINDITSNIEEIQNTIEINNKNEKENVSLNENNLNNNNEINPINDNVSKKYEILQEIEKNRILTNKLIEKENMYRTLQVHFNNFINKIENKTKLIYEQHMDHIFNDYQRLEVLSTLETLSNKINHLNKIILNQNQMLKQYQNKDNTIHDTNDINDENINSINIDNINNNVINIENNCIENNTINSIKINSLEKENMLLKEERNTFIEKIKNLSNDYVILMQFVNDDNHINENNIIEKYNGMDNLTLSKNYVSIAKLYKQKKNDFEKFVSEMKEKINKYENNINILKDENRNLLHKESISDTKIQWHEEALVLLKNTLNEKEKQLEYYSEISDTKDTKLIESAAIIGKCNETINEKDEKIKKLEDYIKTIELENLKTVESYKNEILKMKQSNEELNKKHQDIVSHYENIDPTKFKLMEENLEKTIGELNNLKNQTQEKNIKNKLLMEKQELLLKTKEDELVSTKTEVNNLKNRFERFKGFTATWKAKAEQANKKYTEKNDELNEKLKVIKEMTNEIETLKNEKQQNKISNEKAILLASNSPLIGSTTETVELINQSTTTMEIEVTPLSSKDLVNPIEKAGNKKKLLNDNTVDMPPTTDLKSTITNKTENNPKTSNDNESELEMSSTKTLEETVKTLVEPVTLELVKTDSNMIQINHSDNNNNNNPSITDTKELMTENKVISKIQEIKKNNKVLSAEEKLRLSALQSIKKKRMLSQMNQVNDTNNNQDITKNEEKSEGHIIHLPKKPKKELNMDTNTENQTQKVLDNKGISSRKTRSGVAFGKPVHSTIGVDNSTISKTEKNNTKSLGELKDNKDISSEETK